MQEQVPNDRREGGVKAVHLTLSILEAVASSTNGLGVTELAAGLGFTKSSIFRHLQTLVERGYLVQNPNTARYSIGLRASMLGRLAPHGSDLLSAAQTSMRILRDEIGQTVTLAAVGSKSVLVVERLMGFDLLEIGIRPGSELPLHATSHGKVAMAFSKQPLAVWARTQRLERMTPYTVCDWHTLEQQIRITKQQGWASSPQEILLGFNAVSAPIFDSTGDCVAALAIVGSIQFVPPHPTATQLKALLHATQSTSHDLGYRPGNGAGAGQ
jgi:IclR family KDG regulon transcriptional repressor